MATDATATPTSQGIPKINPLVDAPSGNGENAMMDAIDALLVARTKGLTATGDLLYTTAANTPARLPIGSAGQVLTVVGGVPVWAAAPVVSVPTYTWATLPIVGTHGTNGQPDAFVVDTLNGVSGIWPFEYRVDLDATYRWRIVGGNTPPYVLKNAGFDNSANNSWFRPSTPNDISLPAVAGVWDVGVQAHGYIFNNFFQGVGISTTNTVSPTGPNSVGATPGVGTFFLNLQGMSFTLAASATLYTWVNRGANSSTFGNIPTLLRPVKVAGNV